MLNLNSLVSKLIKIEWSSMRTCLLHKEWLVALIMNENVKKFWAAILTFVDTLSAFSFIFICIFFLLFCRFRLVLSLFSPQSLSELATPLAMSLSSLLSSLKWLELVRIYILPSLIPTLICWFFSKRSSLNNQYDLKNLRLDD